jgi:Flp pilus assembly protein TadD
MGGAHGEAERVLREAIEMPQAGSYTMATLGYALAHGGKRAEAQQILREVESTARRGYVSPVALATLHIGLGEYARALDQAELALEERRGWLSYLRVNPMLDPLRGEPRFHALVRRMGL